MSVKTMNDFECLPALQFFRQIAAIPRVSGNEQAMQKFLVVFAQSHHLPFYQDEFNNVIIYKQTAPVEPLILQAHTDMVGVKAAQSTHDFARDGIKLVTEGKFLRAQATSLGADDGIGVALILELLAADLPMNIEAVFTASEETTMQGAYNLDVSRLKGKKLICLDGFVADTIMTSCASFTDFKVDLGQQYLAIPKEVAARTYKIVLSGLAGGHSGFNIDQQRGNSHQLMAQFLTTLPDLWLQSWVGGQDYNVIPSRTEVVVTTTAAPEFLTQAKQQFLSLHQKTYPHLQITWQAVADANTFWQAGTELLALINEFPHGVLMQDGDGNVVLSQNLSTIDTTTGIMKIGLRANLPEKEPELVANLQALCQKYHFQGDAVDRQPSFNTLPHSSLLAALQKANPAAKVVKMHIAVECGILQSRMPGLDAVIIAPTITDAHSINEKLDLASVASTAKWLRALVTNMLY